jgi:hypothetical protein
VAAATAYFANIAKAPWGLCSLVRGVSASRHSPEILFVDHPSLAPNYPVFCRQYLVSGENEERRGEVQAIGLSS